MQKIKLKKYIKKLVDVCKKIFDKFIVMVILVGKKGIVFLKKSSTLLKDIGLAYSQPYLWQQKLNSKKTAYTVVIFIFTFALIGVAFNFIWKFYYFYIYASIFILILVIILIAEAFYSRIINKIRALTNHMDGFQIANTFYSKFEKSILYSIIPPLIVLVFEVEGILLYDSAIFTPTFIWCLVLFAIVIHISIIGHIQYLAFFVYIMKVSQDPEPFHNLIKKNSNTIPAETDWLRELTRLSHVFRNVFFTLGSLFIIAFGCFCFIPFFQIDINNILFYIMWGNVFLAIVVLFPIISITEILLIKKIVKKVKDSYVDDLKKESDFFAESVPQWLKPSVQMIQSFYAIQISKSEEYPIKNKASNFYAVAVSVFNFAASIVTMLQFVNKISLFA